jgi:hypothetical protein
MNLDKKQILVPMTYIDLHRLVAWTQLYIEGGSIIVDNLKIMLKVLDHLKSVDKEIVAEWLVDDKK